MPSLQAASFLTDFNYTEKTSARQTAERVMKECTLNHFTESLAPWLDDNYIRNVVLHHDGRVTFSFMDNVSDTYEISDCNVSEIRKICEDLAKRGIPVLGLA